ncbi:hypothetical protein GCM10023083_24420 [Streptomyces phyllanthi]
MTSSLTSSGLGSLPASPMFCSGAIERSPPHPTVGAAAAAVEQVCIDLAELWLECESLMELRLESARRCASGVALRGHGQRGRTRRRADGLLDTCVTRVFGLESGTDQ